MTSKWIEMELEILCILQMSNYCISQDILGMLTGINSSDINSCISMLIQKRWINKDSDNSFKPTKMVPENIQSLVEARVSRSVASEMLGRLNARDMLGQVTSDLLIALYVKAGLENEAPAVLLENARKESEKNNLQAASSQCRACLALLRNHLDDKAGCNIFLDAALLFSDIGFLRQRYNEITDILSKAENAAVRLGDRRRMAMVHLHYGRAAMFLNLLDKVVQKMEEGFDLISDITDRDISDRVAAFRSHYFYAQGLCKETAEASEEALLFSPGYPPLFDPVVATNFAMAAANMGHMQRAIGILDSLWRQSVGMGLSKWTQNFSRIVLGQMFLMCRKMPEASIHLLEGSKVARESKDAVSLFWAGRALAYYYYLRGRYHDSYKTMSQTMEDARGSGFPSLFFGIPWFIEMLFQFHRMGYAPIPGCEYSKVIKTAMDGPNILLKGVALRVHALELQDQSNTPHEIETLLVKSRIELERSGATFELAKTCIELARLKLKEGAETEAKKLALKAWDLWPRHEFDTFPGGLKSLIENEIGYLDKNVCEKTLLVRYMRMSEEIIKARGIEKIESLLLNATCKFFEAERGGIFLPGDHSKSEKMRLLSGFNLTDFHCRQRSFIGNLSVALEAYNSWRPISVSLPALDHDQFHDPVCSVLCLPVKIGEKKRAIFYYDTRYIRSNLEGLGQSFLNKITAHMEIMVSDILKSQTMAQEKSAAMLSQITSTNGQALGLKMDFGPPFRHLIAMADRIAPSDASVLILGETGTGKSVLARRIHDLSQRNTGPFVAIDLSAISESLLESEIFGHEKGSFTGADRQKRGLMELAQRGTLFLDEIGEIPKSVQLKLLHAIEEKSFVRVGGVVKKTADFRLVAATNRDLVKEVEKGNFREDLYYRICVVPFIVPPLRERGDDVILLAEKFLSYYSHKYHRPDLKLSAEHRETLKSYHWPGNIRELKNLIERSVLLSEGVGLNLAVGMASEEASTPGLAQRSMFADKPTLDEVQRRYIDYILNETGGKIAGPHGAAAILGIKRSTLQHRIKKLFP